MKWIVVLLLFVTPAYGQMIVKRRGITGAPVCGDGIRNGSDQCDGSDFGGATCGTYGCSGGSLTCTGGCIIDTSTCTGCGSNIAFVQAISATTEFNGSSSYTSTTTGTLTPSGSGHFLVAVVTAACNQCDNAGSHVRDSTDSSSGGNYTLGPAFYDSDPSATQCLAIYYQKNISSTARTITWSVNGGCQYVSVLVAEYSGVDTSSPVEASPPTPGVTAGNAALAWVTPSITPLSTKDMLFSAAMLDNVQASTCSGNAAGASATERYDQFNTGSPIGAMAIQDLINSGTATQTMTGTMSPTSGTPAWRILSAVMSVKSQ